MASVVLHWFHPDPYPILDFRACWSLGLEDETCNLSFWFAYVSQFRDLMDRTGLTKRQLDRALWQLSKENQT